MTRLYAILGAIGALLASIAGAFALGGRSEKSKHRAEQAEANLDAEINRRKLDDEIASDPDLAARARRIGLQRPGRK